MRLTKEQKEVWNNLKVIEKGYGYINYQYKNKKMYITKCGPTWYYSTSIEDDFGWREDTEEYYDLTKAQVAQVILDHLNDTHEVKTGLEQIGITKDEFGNMINELTKEFDPKLDEERLA